MIKKVKTILNAMEEVNLPSMLSKMYFFLRLMIVPIFDIDNVLPKKGTILDIGCGNGPMSLYLSLSSKARKVIGWDIDKKRLDVGKLASVSLKNMTFEKNNAVTNDYGQINAVMASDFLHHIPYNHQEIVVRKISKILPKKGIFLIKEVDKSDIPRYFGSFFFDHLLYPKDVIYFRSKKEWIDLLKKNGLSVSVKKTLFWFPASTTLFICKK